MSVDVFHFLRMKLFKLHCFQEKSLRMVNHTQGAAKVLAKTITKIETYCTSLLPLFAFEFSLFFLKAWLKYLTSLSLILIKISSPTSDKFCFFSPDFDIQLIQPFPIAKDATTLLILYNSTNPPKSYIFSRS